MMLIRIGFIVFILFLTGCQQKSEKHLQEARLNYLVGQVIVNNQAGKIGQNLPEGSTITTGDESLAEIKIGLYSGTQLREQSDAQIVLTQSGYEIIATRGAMLNLVRKGQTYLHRGPVAVIAVRGTIFYVNCYNDSVQYICTCNGTIGISDGNGADKLISGTHHNPYLVTKSDTGIVFKPDVMKEHDDIEIFEFMYRTERI